MTCRAIKDNSFHAIDIRCLSVFLYLLCKVFLMTSQSTQRC